MCMRKILIIFLGLMLILCAAPMVRAQSTAYADIYLPDAQAFPVISTLLDVFDGQGQFVFGLKAADVTVLEDGQSRPVDELSELALGARLVVAINPGPSLAVRDPGGIPRYDKVMQVLRGWAESRPADNADDMNLVTIAGPLLTHATLSDWLINFTAYQPDFRAAAQNIQSLTMALDAANAPTSQPGTKRAILFLTPLIEPSDLSTLEVLTMRAVQSKVRVFVWLIDSETSTIGDSATALKALALQSGGSFFAFSEAETLPDPETYFAPLRHIYTLKYSSKLATPGNHTLSVQAQTSAGQIASSELTFTLDVQPPNPILVSPPLQIVRQAPSDDPYNTKILVPSQHEIEIIVEFPDGHPRPLVSTILYVDGQVVGENAAEPFDKFIWDLSGYTTSGQHEVIVEAEDSLGLSKTSMSLPVIVTVVHPPSGLRAFISRNRALIVVGAIVLTGLVLLLILFMGGKLRLPSLAARRHARKMYEDPLTQPVEISSERDAPVKGHAKRLPWAHLSKEPAAPAYLVRLIADGQPASGSPIQLTAHEMTFGTDPVQASYVLDDLSVSPLHARLQQTGAGDFILADQGSVAGTWVNYELITRQGCHLEHGDVINFGQLTYRFSLCTPPALPEPQIVPEKTG